MAGSGRRGAVRKASKKNVGGSDGQKRGLRSKGLTPKVEDHVYHAARKRTNGKCRRDSGRHGCKGDDTELIVDRSPVVGYLYAKVPAVALIVTLGTGGDERLQEPVCIASSRGIPIREVLRHELDTMTGSTIHQGIGLRIPSYKYSSIEDLIDSVAKIGEPGLIICPDNITDPHNLSAVIRLVAAFDGHGVVIPEWRLTAITDAAWYTSAGTATRLSTVRATNMVRSLEQFQEVGYQIVGLDAGDDHTLGAYDDTAPVVVVIGFEGKGLSRLVRGTRDTIMSIPMTDWVESFSAPVAMSVTLSGFARQRRARSSQ